MSDPNTTYIDLDAVDLPRKIVVKLGGEQHELVPVTVEAFVANTKLLQKLANTEGDFEAEVNTVIEVILRAFPTMTDAMLRKLPLVNLNKLMAAAQADDGTNDVKQAAEKEAKANPPAAAE